MGFFDDLGDVFTKPVRFLGDGFSNLPKGFEVVGNVFKPLGNVVGKAVDRSLNILDRGSTALLNGLEGIGNILNSPVLLIVGGIAVLYIVTSKK